MIIDVDHLDRATAGDLTLRQELLVLFRDQLLAASGTAGDPSPGCADLSTAALHRLRGAAEAIGATSLAGDLARAEASSAVAADRHPDDATRLGASLRETLDAVGQLIAAHERRGLAKGGESG